jgi:chromosome segregation ATPase
MKQNESVHIFEESQQVIENLRTQLEEARKIEENLEYQKKYLEANIAAQKEEAEMIENILTDHLKERTKDINQLETNFGQEEKRLEEEIITLKILLEEAKRTEEVMKSQIMNKEEDVEKLEEKIVILRSKILKLNKNVEETKTSTLVIENEEKHSRFLEKKNEENRKSYVEVLLVNPNIRKLLKIHLKEDHPCSIHKEASIMIMISQDKISEGIHHKEDHSLPGMQISFMIIVFIVLILDIRLQIAGIIKMFKQQMPMWPHVTLNITNVITMDT